MAWNSLPTLVYGVLVTATHWAQVKENIEILGALKSNGTALSALAAAAEIRGPDYDSGWFAVTTSTVYTKAHSLSVTPKHVEIYHAAVAAPGAGDEIVRVLEVITGGGVRNSNLGADGTNVYAQTDAGAATDGTCNSLRRKSSSGYYRILAWK